MVVLIAGASHTGKTALAQSLLEQKGYPYLSIDLLKMGLIRSGQTNLSPEDDAELTEYLWPIVREMIKTAIENRQNLAPSAKRFFRTSSRPNVRKRRLEDGGAAHDLRDSFFRNRHCAGIVDLRAFACSHCCARR